VIADAIRSKIMRELNLENTHVYGATNKVKLDCTKGGAKSKSRTRQEFKDSADINKIMKKYERTGILSSGDVSNSRQPQYGDYEGIDYMETCNKIAKVEQDFMKQPPEVRALCENDPRQWLLKLDTDEKEAIKAAEEANKARLEKQAAKEAAAAEEDPV
jgi:hypothetical protein